MGAGRRLRLGRGNASIRKKRRRMLLFSLIPFAAVVPVYKQNTGPCGHQYSRNLRGNHKYNVH